MNQIPAKLAFTVIVAALLACIAAWIVSARYRAAMRRLMSAPVETRAAPGPARPAVPVPNAPPAPVTLADNRREAMRLTLLLVVASCLMAVSSAALWQHLSLDLPLAWKRIAMGALTNTWLVVPALAFVWHWSWRRMLAVLLMWVLLCYSALLWRSIEWLPLKSAEYLAFTVGPPMVLILLLFGSARTRAVAPWLLVPFIGLVWASIVGVELLGFGVGRRSPALIALTRWMPVDAVIPFFAIAPWLIAWWPMRWLGRALGRAYARQWLSETLVLFTALWAISLTDNALDVAIAKGAVGAAMLLPLLWIPLLALLGAARRRGAARPPTLLVLRVFQRDAQVQGLFDHVVERWRLSGNTVLIAGTDLADRTLDADDIFTFLDGGLAQRFIRSPADVAPRLTGFAMARDLDGRFRVNECYCHDSTWQDALHALVQRSDVVLMDLRSFRAHNAGCRYELGALGEVRRPLRVVVLTDGDTDRAAAAEAVAHAPPERFVWLDTSTVDAAKQREVLAALFPPGNAGACHDRRFATSSAP